MNHLSSHLLLVVATSKWEHSRYDNYTVPCSDMTTNHSSMHTAALIWYTPTHRLSKTLTQILYLLHSQPQWVWSFDDYVYCSCSVGLLTYCICILSLSLRFDLRRSCSRCKVDGNFGSSSLNMLWMSSRVMADMFSSVTLGTELERRMRPWLSSPVCLVRHFEVQLLFVQQCLQTTWDGI